MKKPFALRQGDLIAMIAPSSPVSGADAVRRAAENLEQSGFRVRIYDSCCQKYGYLAGSDRVRAADVSEAFADERVRGIVCLRGGTGAMRILDRLDYERIAAHPKVFVGYSDITALHLAIGKKCGMVTFHGPMAAELGENADAFTRSSWLDALTSGRALGAVRNPPGMSIGSFYPGRARGTLAGGNLTLIAATLGTQYELDARGKLLLLEDVGEEPYRIDRMLTQLRLAGKFDECAGIVLGDWKDCVPAAGKESLSLTQIFAELAGKIRKPMLCGLQAGHCSQKVTLPLGVEAVLDADTCRLILTENAALDPNGRQ